MNEMLISIIVPIYNVEEYLPECIESLQKQTHQLIEIILVDDDSQDNCLEICYQYEKNDNRIIVIHKNNGGVSSARNAGLKRATGEYIGFVDADDTIEPQMYEAMLTNILIKDAQMCVNSMFLINQEKSHNAILNKQIYTKKEAIKELLHMNFPISLWSCLYKNDIIKDIYLDETIYYWEDFEFQFRILNNVEKIAINNFGYYHYRQRPDSLNHQSINDKILSCLLIPGKVNETLTIKYPELKKHGKNINLYFLQIIIGKLANSSFVEEKYYKIVTTYAKQYFFPSIYSKDIKFVMKLYILICTLSSKIFWKLYRFMKKLSSYERK